MPLQVLGGLHYKLNMLLTEPHYLPSIAFFEQLTGHDTLLLEACAHYTKGSYRNRCHIATGNGVLRLSIPLQQGKNQQQAMQEVRIANDTRWQQQHWRTLVSAYSSAAFWLYFADAIMPFYHKKYEFLFDFNTDLLTQLLQIMKLPIAIERTTSYQIEVDTAIVDARNTLTTKLLPQNTLTKTYPQVFMDKHGFLPNLSIIDALFCAGPAFLSP